MGSDRSSETTPRGAWYAAAARSSARLLLIAAAVAVLATAVIATRAVVLPIVFAVVLAAVLAPVVQRLRRWGLHPTLTSVIAIALLGVLAVGAVVLTSRSIIAQWDGLSRTISAGLDEIEEHLQDWFNLSGEQTGQTRDALGSASKVLGKAAVNGLVTIVPAVVELVSGVLLSVFVLFYFLKDGQGIWLRMTRRFPARRDAIDRIGTGMWETLGRFTRGTTLIAAIDAGGIGLGMWLLDVPFPAAVAVLTFLLAYIPLVGALMSGTFGVLLALGDGGLSKALAALAVVLVVQWIEGNLLQPFIMGNAVSLHPLAVAFALVLGGTFAGVIGMFLAVPVTAVAAAAVAELQASPAPGEDRASSPPTP